MYKKSIVDRLILIFIIIIAAISLFACNEEGEETQDPVLRTITFVSNGGNEVEVIVGYEGTEITAPVNPQRENYIFDD